MQIENDNEEAIQTPNDQPRQSEVDEGNVCQGQTGERGTSESLRHSYRSRHAQAAWSMTLSSVHACFAAIIRRSRTRTQIPQP